MCIVYAIHSSNNKGCVVFVSSKYDSTPSRITFGVDIEYDTGRLDSSFTETADSENLIGKSVRMLGV